VTGIAAPPLPSLVDPRLDELVGNLGPAAGATAYLEELRWPDGVTCVRCTSLRVGFIKTRLKYGCRDCGYQFRVTAGTVLHDSHVPAYKWLLAVQLMLESVNGFPANRLYALIGGSYKTSWFVEHRVRAAMAQALLDDRVITVALEQVSGSAYHRPGVAHLPAYWAETRWRLDHIGTKDAYRATALALLAADPVSYRKLTRHPGSLPRPLPPGPGGEERGCSP